MWLYNKTIIKLQLRIIDKLYMYIEKKCVIFIQLPAKSYLTWV